MSITSIKSQTEKCFILGVCSNIEDYNYANSLDINVIMCINLPLGIKYQFGMEYCKLFYPKNVIIMGSDDTISNNYIENINKYIDKYDIVGLNNWRIKEIPSNDIYILKYSHKIINGYWGGTNSIWKKLFNTNINGFMSKNFVKCPFSIGAGRSLGFKILNKLNWQVYVDASINLDTICLFNLIILNKANYITLNSNVFYMTSIKDNSIEMITTKEAYMNCDHITVTPID